MTSLFINNNLISSFADLKSELLGIKNSQSTAAQEVRRYFIDGVLQDWLNDGDDKEKELALLLNAINPQQDDTSLLREIVSIICSVDDVRVHKVDSAQCLLLDSIEYSDHFFIDSRIIGTDKVPVSSSAKKIYFKLNFKVLESCNEAFHISMYTSSSDGMKRIEFFKKVINPSMYKRSEICSFNIDYEDNILDGETMSIAIDDVRIKSFVLQKTTTISETLSNHCHPRFDGNDLVLTVNGVTFKMKYIKGGMCKALNLNVHSFYMGEVLVTMPLYRAVMGFDHIYDDWGEIPKDIVSWYECQEFISRISYLTKMKFRLPNLEEFFFAAQGGVSEHGAYLFTENEDLGENPLESVAWLKSNSNGMTHPVATLKPNTLGLYDMLGNVRIWLQDSLAELISRLGNSLKLVDSLKSLDSYEGGRLVVGLSYQDSSKEDVNLRFFDPYSRKNTIGFRLVCS